MYLCIYHLSICLFISIIYHLPMYLSIYFPSIYLSTCLPTTPLSLYLYHLYLYLYFCLYLYFYLYVLLALLL